MSGTYFKNKKYDNMIMSWSCFGDFVLVSQSMKTLIDNGIIKKGIIITHQKELKGLLGDDEKIELLYPTQSIKDLFRLLTISVQKNIFILHDMPSHNRFSKEIRFIMSIILTIFRLKSKLVLMLDKQFKENTTTKISKLFASSQVIFDKTKRIHISQYMLDLLHESKIIDKIKSNYDIRFNEKEIDIKRFGTSYIAMNPFASSEDKNMNTDWYIGFLNKLEKLTNKKVILLGSHKDKVMAEEIVKNTTNAVSLCGETNFREVLYILKNSSGVISVDSGPMHYAALYKKPQIMLWGENKNFVYMPIHNPNAIFIFGKQILKSEDVYKSEINFEKYADTDTVLNTCKELNF
jgi:ADP-heptose:LPS heptosyltransferase